MKLTIQPHLALKIKNKWSYTPSSTIHPHGMVRVTLALPWNRPNGFEIQQENQLCEFCLQLLVKENGNGWKV
jgi:hypothetical protein